MTVPYGWHVRLHYEEKADLFSLTLSPDCRDYRMLRHLTRGLRSRSTPTLLHPAIGV
jgi:hypothetical protein